MKKLLSLVLVIFPLAVGGFPFEKDNFKDVFEEKMDKIASQFIISKKAIFPQVILIFMPKKMFM